MVPALTRRTVLSSASIGTAGALAGCLGTAASSGDSSATSTPPGPTTTVDDPTTTATPAGVDGSTLPPGEEWQDRINVVRGWADHRPADQVDVAVGGHAVTYAFSPALLTVTPGTTVVWQWTGRAGPNNVVGLDGGFDSGRPVDRQGHTFRTTFESEGDYRYLSEPNAECGMGGLVRVESIPQSDYPELNRWLRNTDNFEGKVVDRTGTASVTVTVGAAGNGGNFAFDPPAVKVSPGTTVRWRWTGKGGAHDVVFDEAEVRTGDLWSEQGRTFEHTYEEAGVYLYQCRPHASIGQRGALVVE